MMCKRIPPDGLEEPLPFYTQRYATGKWQQIKVDCCLVPLITTLHSQGIRTLGSCCGHDRHCGGIVIDNHSVAKAIQSGYRVNTEWRPNDDGEFIIYQIERFNDSCRGCGWDEGCPCSCHGTTSISSIEQEVK